MTFPKDELITVEVLTKFMEKHKLEVARYEYLKNMYRGIMSIDDEPTKDHWKPDNRLTVNFTNISLILSQVTSMGFQLKSLIQIKKYFLNYKNLII